MFDFGLYTQVSDSGPHGPLVFILIPINIKVPLVFHTKIQPNIPSPSGENDDFNTFAILVMVAILNS